MSFLGEKSYFWTPWFGLTYPTGSYSETPRRRSKLCAEWAGKASATPLSEQVKEEMQCPHPNLWMLQLGKLCWVAVGNSSRHGTLI